MSPEYFVETRRSDWERLASLLEKANASVQSLSPLEVQEVGRLYRATTSDLAIAQRDFPRHDAAVFLNQLVAQGHAMLYRDRPFSWRQIGRFFTHTIPQTFRETWRFFAVASLLFWLPALVGMFAVLVEPDSADLVLPQAVQAIVPAIEDNEPWFFFEGDEQPQATGLITTNNIRVSILAFAGGVAAGVYTLVVLFTNGLMAGGIIGVALNHEFYDLLNFMVGHGVIELNMICLAGAAGLLFTWAIIRPGYLTRADALFVAGRKALILLLTCAIFLVVAGLIEGFISPREFLNPVVKWVVGFSSGSLMFIYLLVAGREDRSAEAAVGVRRGFAEERRGV